VADMDPFNAAVPSQGVGEAVEVADDAVDAAHAHATRVSTIWSATVLGIGVPPKKRDAR